MTHTDLDEQPSDNAAAAFDAMREELALLRSAVRGFAARQDELAARDYSEDIARLIALQRRLIDRTNALSQRPALALTPQSMAAEIANASTLLRQGDQKALIEVMHCQADITQRLQTIVGGAREQREQLDALIWAWLIGTITVLALVIGRLLIEGALS